MIDYHVHCDYSVDAEGAIDEYVEQALEKDLRRICFTTHCDLEPGRRHHDGRVRVDGRIIDVTSDWLESYIEDVGGAARRFSGSGIEIACGLEVGFVPGIEKMIEDFIASFDLDFILAGIHTLRGVDIVSSRESSEYFKERTPRQVCEDYYSYVAEAAVSGLFDSIAHLDIYKKCGLDFYGTDLNDAHWGLLEPVLDKIAVAGLALEVNSASIRKGRSVPYPSPDILKNAAEAGVSGLTFGSDCHSPVDIGSDIDTCLSLARRAGYSSVLVFENRRRSALAIEELAS
jgi:histidinol-phosphatase (PHP family)